LVLFLSSRFTLPLSVITVLPPRLNSSFFLSSFLWVFVF
jgi:hypothetical protein